MRLIVIVLAVFLFAAESASAFCFDEAGKMYHVDPLLLWSIAKHESRMKPDAVNVNSNGSMDYGLMQINSWWVKKKKISPAQWQSLGDPCINVKVGAWILSQCIRQHGYTWKAVGCYNAVTERKQQRYAKIIFGIYDAAKQADRGKNQHLGKHRQDG